jgi:ERCC4-type nuclease
MSFILKIDFREKDLVEIFDKENDIKYQKESLELGDITFEYNNKIIIIIERKKLQDLSDSLYDGRYKEQKKRIIDSLDKKIRKIYLIEGDQKLLWKTKMNIKTFDGIKINTIIRDNLHYIHVNNFDETIKLIKDIYTRLPKYVSKIYKEIYDEVKEETCYSSVCNINKKKNLTPEIYKIIQLQQIPNVSNNIAKLIIENVGSLRDIIIKYQSDEEILNLKNIISELKYGEKKRRIGKKLTDKIIKYIFN